MPKLEITSGMTNGGVQWRKIKFWPRALSDRAVRFLHAKVGWPTRGTYIFDDRGRCTDSYNTHDDDGDQYAQDGY